MIKYVHLLSRKHGISDGDFRDYYETRHAPLLTQLVPRVVRRRHSFLLPGATVQMEHMADAPAPPGFNLIAEAWLEDRKQFDRLRDDFGIAEIGETIASDEENFIDRHSTVIFGAEEYATPSSDLSPGQFGPDDRPMLKVVCMIRRKPDLSRESFIDYYETRHAPLSVKHLPMLAGYTRSYMIPGCTFTAGYKAALYPAPQIDVMTAIWFRTPSDRDAHAVTMANPAVGAVFARDEAELFDRSSIQVFRVEETEASLGKFDKSASDAG